MDQSHIRNFCIIAHIDHGKSTLADRLLELTGTVEKRAMHAQMLDRMDLERERGITIKLQPVRMEYHPSAAHIASSVAAGGSRGMPNTAPLPSSPLPSTAPPRKADPGEVYELNLIDTPGHVDFSYEVSRSLQACEGALLVVDASQGIQAQTLANVYLAMAADLKIVPVLNKIDLPAADVERTGKEVMNLLGCTREDILLISAKTGQGVDKVLDAIIERLGSPTGQPQGPTRALIFDSYYDDYRGVILYVRVVDGELAKGDNISMMASGASGIALELGHLSPAMVPDPKIAAGEIGYIVTNLKTTHDARVGDTVTLKKYFDGGVR